MAGIDLVTSLECDSGNCLLERIRLKIHLRTADPANQMVVVMSSQLIGKVTTANLGGMDDVVPG